MRQTKLGILITSQWQGRGVQEAKRGLGDLEKSTGGLGKVTEGVFAGIGLSLSNFALGLAGKATQAVQQFVSDSTRAFASFDKQMREVFTLLPNISAEGMARMRRDVLELAQETGRLPEEVVPALYQAISAGVPADNVFTFLSEESKAARGGVTDLKTAVDATTNVTNAYGLSVISATQANDLMFTAVRLGKTTFEELAGKLYNVVPVAAAVGVSFDQITAALATMTAQGVPTAQATVQLRQLLQELSKENTQVAATFRQVSGVSFTEFIANGGTLADALQLLDEYAQGSNQSVKDLFTSVEAGGASLALTGQGAATYARNLEESARAAGATEEANNRMVDSVDAVIGRTEATTEVLKIQVGEALEPATRAWLNLKLAAAQWAGDAVHNWQILNNINAVLREQTDLTEAGIAFAADAIRVADDEERSYRRLRIAMDILRDGTFAASQTQGTFEDALRAAIEAQDAAIMRSEEMNRVYGELYGITVGVAAAQEEKAEADQKAAQQARITADETERMLNRYLALPPAFWAVETSGKGTWGAINKLRLEQDAAAAAAERHAAAQQRLADAMRPSMQKVRGYIDEYFEAQERLNSTPIWDVAGVQKAKADMEAAFAGIAEAHRQMVMDIYVQNANLGDGFDDNAAKIAVALGLMTAEEAEMRVQAERTGAQIGNLADQLTKTFLEDGYVSRQEAELLSQAIGAIEEGTLTADEALRLFTEGSLADYLAGMEEGRTKTSLARDALLKLAGNYEIDVDSSDLDTARSKVDGFPKNISLTVDVTYNDPGYMPGPGDPGYVPGTDSGPIKRSTGGPVPLTRGAMPGRDSVRAWLTPGEYVLTTADVARLGGASGVRSMLAAPRLGPPDAAYNYPSAAWGDAGTSATPAPGNDTYIFNVPDAANARLIAQVVRDGRRANRLLYAFGRGDD